MSAVEIKRNILEFAAFTEGLPFDAGRLIFIYMDNDSLKKPAFRESLAADGCDAFRN